MALVCGNLLGAMPLVESFSFAGESWLEPKKQGTYSVAGAFDGAPGPIESI